jgi:hypothetical protein
MLFPRGILLQIIRTLHHNLVALTNFDGFDALLHVVNGFPVAAARVTINGKRIASFNAVKEEADIYAAIWEVY